MDVLSSWPRPSHAPLQRVRGLRNHLSARHLIEPTHPPTMLMHLMALHYPSLSSLEQPSHEFRILAPTDNAVLRTPVNTTKDLELRYAARGYGTGRLCLSLKNGPLQYYRGPILHRDPAQVQQYASGCFTLGQPVTIKGLHTGMYSLDAELRSTTTDAVLGGGGAVHPTSWFAVVAGPDEEFEPTYEWQAVEDGQSIPSGLDVKLSLDSHRNVARIPPTWRLQVFTPGIGFLRHDVSRTTRLRELEEAAVAEARHHGATGAECAASLWAGADPLAPSLTAEESQLFLRRSALKVHLEGCELPAGTRGHEFDAHHHHGEAAAIETAGDAGAGGAGSAPLLLLN